MIRIRAIQLQNDSAPYTGTACTCGLMNINSRADCVVLDGRVIYEKSRNFNSSWLRGFGILSQ